jgi:outer membrane protein insertion porin family
MLLLLLGMGLLPAPVAGQAPLRLVNGETTVREVSFRFVGGQTFEASRLQEQIATTAPGFFARLRNRLAFLPGLRRRSFQFDPVTLQKDVVRLRRFYQQNGFLRPSVDYPASQLDTTENEIHVIFTIREGTPLTIREMAFLTPDGTQPVTTLLDEQRRRRWARFRTQSGVRLGERYTDFKRSQIEDGVRTWLRNQGYAFAQVRSDVQIDSTANAATLRFRTDPGPPARVSEIAVEGNTAISDEIVRRELPFEVGDRFSAADVTDGQRALFDLNLFRVALADVPEQPRDSTVTVRYRVRETKLRAYSGQIGYGTQAGVTLEGSWRHRNFQGDARSFIVSLVADTGFPQNPSRIFPFLDDDPTKTPDRLFRASTTLRQPYLFTDRLSGTLEPFIQERRNLSLSPTPDREFQLLERLRLNERQFGLNTTLIYDFLPFRSLSLQHSFARTEQFRGTVDADTLGAGRDDLFGTSVFSLSGTFGKADDFINPSRGYIVRPAVELGGVPFESGVDFARVSGELSGYLPVSDNIELAGRVFGGLLNPIAESRTNLTIAPTAPDSLLRRNRTFQDRFSDYLFYAGGGSDVRGWTSQLAGGKVLRDLAPRNESATEYAYRPVGARSKLGVNLEVRLPFPGLGDSWRTAVFVDAAYLDTDPLNLAPPSNVAGVVAGPDGRAVTTEPTRVLVGTGGGLRYQTPFGFLRLDLAYKLTPDAFDVRRPEAVGRAVEQGQPATAASTRSIRRFRLHFGIGRSF